MSEPAKKKYHVCSRCGVEIVDTTERCPLCQHVLSPATGEENMTYPDVRVAVRKFRFLENLLLYLSLVAETVLVFLNVSLNPEILWSPVVGLGLLYVNVVVRLAVVGRSGYLFKTVSLAVTAILVLLGIDYLTGYRGWALDFVLPIGILLMDLGTLLLMIVNSRNWQSYMMLEILILLVSLVHLILFAEHIVHYYYLVSAAFLGSLFLFLGTLILGDRRARDEMRRRFHI